VEVANEPGSHLPGLERAFESRSGTRTFQNSRVQQRVLVAAGFSRWLVL